MSRRRQSLIDEILQGFVELPFWASILGAVFTFLALRLLPPLLAGSSLTGKVFATALPTLAPWAATAILAAGLIGVAIRKVEGFPPLQGHRSSCTPADELVRL